MRVHLVSRPRLLLSSKKKKQDLKRVDRIDVFGNQALDLGRKTAVLHWCTPFTVSGWLLVGPLAEKPTILTKMSGFQNRAGGKVGACTVALAAIDVARHRCLPAVHESSFPS